MSEDQSGVAYIAGFPWVQVFAKQGYYARKE
jgi:hypothetical protein